jgi:trans-2,3-dihydro-3-hydroxyanthranilate isomerase
MSATEFIQVDVFSTGPYTGNPLAVFPDAADLSGEQMQTIASEMNLSETSFVTNVDDDAYDVRIFTPAEELPFAGHPTLGTAWCLRHLKMLTGSEVTQRSAAGETPVAHRGGEVEFTRTGSVGNDVTNVGALAHALSLPEDAIGLEANLLGQGSGFLMPAPADSGITQLMVPIRDRGWLAAASPKPADLAGLGEVGAYCFTYRASGEIQARGFFPGIGVAEDPATGSACAGLGLYLADRLGEVAVEVHQGIEMGRPSRLGLRAKEGRVHVSGRCVLVLKGSLEELP